MTELEAGRRYSFSTYSPAVLQDRYTDVVFEGEVTYSVARTLAGYDIAARHTAVRRDLPASTPDSAAELSYYLFSNGETTLVFAKAWIRPESIETSEVITRTFVLEHRSRQAFESLFATFAALDFTVKSVSE